MSRELKRSILLLGAFLAAYFIPWSSSAVQRALGEAVLLLQAYVRREQIFTALVPVLFIAGAISALIPSAAVLRYLGRGARRSVAYGVASVSGAVLTVCSCSVLPLFAGIYTRGAGLGPAVAFLYSGPAINVLAIALTARVLGPSLGIARAVGAVAFSILIGVAMHALFRAEERRKAEGAMVSPEPEPTARPPWKTALLFFLMVAVLVFANWSRPTGLTITLRDGTLISGTRVGEDASFLVVQREGGVVRLPKGEIQALTHAPSFSTALWRYRYAVAGIFVGALLVLLALWVTRDEARVWMRSTWDYALLLLPYLFVGILVAGFLFGRPGEEGLIPGAWVRAAVGGDSWASCAVASVAGAFMYFATLTEVPILQGLLGSGMGQGPALALLLAGPALSLPSMLVIGRILGTRKTTAFVLLVVVLSTLAGKLYGAVVGG